MMITLDKCDLEALKKAEGLGGTFNEVIFRAIDQTELRLTWDFNGYDTTPAWWLKLEPDQLVSA